MKTWETFHNNWKIYVFEISLLNLPMLKEQQYYLFGQIKTNQTVGQPYSVGYPYGECYLGPPMLMKMHPTACKSPSYSLSTILSPQKLFAKAFHSKSCNVTLLLLQKITYLKSCRKLSLLKILRLVDQSFWWKFLLLNFPTLTQVNAYGNHPNSASYGCSSAS